MARVARHRIILGPQEKNSRRGWPGLERVNRVKPRLSPSSRTLEALRRCARPSYPGTLRRFRRFRIAAPHERLGGLVVLPLLQQLQDLLHGAVRRELALQPLQRFRGDVLTAGPGSPWRKERFWSKTAQ